MPPFLTSTSPSSPHKSQQKMISPQPQIMAPQEQLVTFCDEDDALSLSDLPVRSLEGQGDERKPSEAMQEFEFRTYGNGLVLKAHTEAHMCVADDIFYRGRLLPLRSCCSQSDPGLGFGCGRSFNSNSISSSNCSSTSISRRQSTSSHSGRGFNSNSNSISNSNCSNTSISRSQSTSSHSSNCDARRLSISNKFYAYPSPKPQARTNISSGRRSMGLAQPGWALIRLGVVKVPEIDLKVRRLRSKDSKCESKVKRFIPRFGFWCKCATDVSEPVSTNSPWPLIMKKKKKKEVGIGLERRESICKSSRMFEWLDELSIL